MHYTSSINIRQANKNLVKDKPIRILHVVGEMVRAGTETWLMNILRNINRDTFKMDFLVHTSDECSYDKEILNLGSKILPIEASTPWAYAGRFKQILREHGPYDIVHSHVHHFSGYILRLAKEEGVPVRIAHSHLNSSLIESNSKFHRRLYIALTKRWINQYATLGLAVSHQALSDLFNQTQNADPRWQLLFCGIDLTNFRYTVDSNTVRTELGIPSDAFVIGHVGRLHPQKNHDFIIDIAAQVAKREPNMRLLLVGEGSLMSDIKEKVVNKDLEHNVIFTGSRSDIPRLMLGAMDTFIFPSLYEGLGLVLVEAQAAGIPCILSDVVPKEADIVVPLMQRLSLLEPASVWAETILNRREIKSNITQLEALKLIESSLLNIQNSTRKLEECYRMSYKNA